MNKTTTTKPLEILSCFDGISCAMLALIEAQIPIANYYSSEIAQAPLQIQNWNFSADTRFHQVGDITKLKGKDFAQITCIIAGSPCTQLSSCNPLEYKGLDGKDSSLFYDLIRLIKEIRAVKPKDEKLYVLLENVNSMRNSEKKKISEALSEALGEEVKPLRINSSDFGAPAERRRLYWGNWDMKLEKFKEQSYQDILVNGYAHYTEKKARTLLSNGVTLTNGIFRKFKMNIGNIVFKHEATSLLPVEKILEIYPSVLEASGYKGHAGSSPDPYQFYNDYYRVPSVEEVESLMCIKKGHVSNVLGVSKSEKYRAIGLGFTVSVVAGLLKSLPIINQ